MPSEDQHVEKNGQRIDESEDRHLAQCLADGGRAGSEGLEKGS